MCIYYMCNLMCYRLRYRDKYYFSYFTRFVDFRRRSRPQSLTLPCPLDGRERRNSAPHLPAVPTTTTASCVDGSRNSLQQQHQQLQLQPQLPPFLSKTAQIEMHQKHGGSLGDLSPQTLIKTKAIRKIHKG